MFEKVNPSHPDKVADRIAGALVDLAYKAADNPKIAAEVLIGHGACHIIAETSVKIDPKKVKQAVSRIAGAGYKCDYKEVPQDVHLAENQENEIRCGDNGIFKGVPVTEEQRKLTKLAKKLYKDYPTDGKFVLDGDKLVICQSMAKNEEIQKRVSGYAEEIQINPLGEWEGGAGVDTGATNRKLGSDMADSVTGGGLHGKDLSKADVAVNIYCWFLAQKIGRPVQMSCAIGDDQVGGVPYRDIVDVARRYIWNVGGFEKFAEWGLV